MEEEKEERRSSGNLLLGLLLFCALVAAVVMHQLGKKALDMDPDSRELNRLMKERTMACAKQNDGQGCMDAINALIAFEQEMTKKNKGK